MKRARYIFCIVVFLAGCGAVELRDDAPAQTVSEAPQEPAVQKQEQEPEPEAQAQPEDNTEKIKQLIELLGHEDWRVREEATAALFGVGKSALGQLAQAAKSCDLEVRERSERTVKQIKWMMDHAPKVLEEAVWDGDAEIARWVLALDMVDLRQVVGKHYGYLHLAAMRGQGEIVEILLEAGVSADSTAGWNKTPLHFAAGREVANILIAHGADSSLADDSGDTPLHQVIACRQDNLAWLLIEESNNLNARNKKGYTALHVAVIVDRVHLCRLLCKKGADVNAKDNHGETPLDKARGLGHSRIFSLLQKNGGESGDDYVKLLDAASAGDIERLRKHIRSGVDANATCMRGLNLLCWAVLVEDYKVVEVLIEEGADVNLAGKAGQTPLHYAAWEGNTKIAKLLVQNGAEISRKDREGRTPLDRVQDANKEMAELLRKHGAKRGKELKSAEK